MRIRINSSFARYLRQWRKTFRRLARLRLSPRQKNAGTSRGLRLLKRLSKLTRLLYSAGGRGFGTGFASLVFALSGFSTLSAQTPVITNVAPTANSVVAARASDIGISFSTTMNLATITAANIRIYGGQSGFLSTSGVFSGNPARVFNPDDDFKAGELISVTVTGAQSSGGQFLTGATVYSFRAAAQGGTGTFSSSTFGSGNSQDVALGDLDGDGDLDAVIANNVAPQEVWLNNGDGTFSSSAFGEATSRSQGLELGDLDGDGDLDAVVVSSGNNHNEIWIGNGDGTFSSSTFGSGRSTDIAFGDLDGDGDLDAVMSSDANTPQHIWFNNGDATFSSTTFGSGQSADVALGDLDGDGDLDAVIGNYNQPQELWLNNGDGSFTSSAFGSRGDNGVDIGDLDGDGDLDVVVAASSNDAQEIWLNNGDATFSSSTFGSWQGGGIALGDLDGDCDLDAIVANAFQGQEIWLNNGDGSFTSSLFGATNWSRDVALGDLDGDGDLDAVIASSGIPSAYPQEIWLNIDPPAPQIVSLSPATNAIAVARNSNIEIGFDAEMDRGSLTTSANTTAANLIVYGSQSGHLTRRATLQYTNGNTQVVIDPAADFKPGEEITVIVTGAAIKAGIALTRATVYSFRAAAEGCPPAYASSPFGSGNSEALALGDLDGDGDLDAIIANYNQANEIWLGRGDGSFTSSSFGSGRTFDVEVGDLDGDGDLDAVFANGNGEAQHIWLNNGDGSFASSVFGNAARIQTGVDLADLDGDGDLDAVFATQQQASDELWLNNGDGTFVSSAFGGGTKAKVAFGDIDKDGDIDLLFSTSASYSLSVHLNDGSAGFGDDGGFGTVPGNDIALGDLDGDGSLDAIVSKNAANEIHINNGNGSFTVVTFGSGNSEGLDLGDLDGDGDLDAIIANNGTQEIWINNGDGSFSSSSFGSGVSRDVALGDLDGDGDLDAIVANNGAQEIWLSGPGSGIQATLDFLSVTTSASVTTALLSNDSGSGLTVTALGQPFNGTASVTNGILSYQADAGFAGVDIFGYSIEDASGCTAAGTIVAVVASNENGMVNIEFVERRKDRSGGVRGLRRAAAVALSPDGAFVYAAGRSDHSIAIFARNATTGSLTYTGRVRNNRNGVSGLKYPNDLAISPDGNNLYALGYGANALLSFAIEDDGGLTFVRRHRQGEVDNGLTIDGLSRPRSLAISPDGANVYVGGYVSNAIAVFKRNTENGRIDYIERHKDGLGGVDGLARVMDVAVSNDGKRVLAAGMADNAIALFNRNASNGTLSFVERKRDGSGGVDGLGGASSVALSPDAGHLYATGKSDRAVTLFAVNATTGSLSFVARYKDGVGGVDGLNGACNVAVSPDGRHVWVAGSLDDAVALFERDASTGELGWLERAKDGEGGVDGLDQTTALLLDPSSKHVYSAGYRDNAVAVLFRNRAPEAQDDAAGSVAPSATLVISPLSNDSDPDGHSITISTTANGTLGTTTITGGGTTIDYDAGAVSGPDSFSYTIDDGHGGTSTATIQLNIVPPKSALNFSSTSRSTPAAAGEETAVTELALYPNPLVDEARIDFNLSSATLLRIAIADVNGRVLQTIDEGEFGAGRHSLRWRAQVESGARLAAGSYLLLLEELNGDGERTRRIALPVALQP